MSGLEKGVDIRIAYPGSPGVFEDAAPRQLALRSAILAAGCAMMSGPYH